MIKGSVLALTTALSAIRQLYNLSQGDVATLARVNRNQVVMSESPRGIERISLPNLDEILSAYRLSLVLVPLTDIKNPEVYAAEINEKNFNLLAGFFEAEASGKLQLPQKFKSFEGSFGDSVIQVISAGVKRYLSSRDTSTQLARDTALHEIVKITSAKLSDLHFACEYGAYLPRNWRALTEMLSALQVPCTLELVHAKDAQGNDVFPETPTPAEDAKLSA